MMHEAIGLDPDFARAHATLGRCYVLYAQGWGGAENFVLAERSLKQRARRSSPTHRQRAAADGLRGPAPRRQGQGRARASPSCCRSSPDDPSVLFVAGMLHRLDGLYEKALATYDRLLEVNPKDVVIVAFNRARIFTHQGRFEEAVAEIDRGRAAEPEHPLLKTFLAVALFNQGMVDDAQALLEDVLRPEPALRRRAAAPRAGASRPAGSTRQARALVTDRVREIAAADHDIALWLAEFYAMEGMTEEALEWVRRAVRIGNENYPLIAEHAASSTRCAPTRASPSSLEELRQRLGGAPPGGGGGLSVSAPEDLLERIRLRLDESFVGIGEVRGGAAARRRRRPRQPAHAAGSGRGA